MAMSQGNVVVATEFWATHAKVEESETNKMLRELTVLESKASDSPKMLLEDIQDELRFSPWQLVRLCRFVTPEKIDVHSWTELLNSDHRRPLANLLQVIINSLNAEQWSCVRKGRVLGVLSSVAKLTLFREEILETLAGLDRHFERDLLSEQRGDEAHMNEYMLLVLMRVTNYQMTADEVLEYTNRRMHNAMLLVAALLEHALDYEHNVLLCCARLLMQFTQPRIIFKMEGGEGTVDEHMLQDFSDKIDFVARFCIRGRVVQTLVDTMLAKGIGVPNAKDGQTSIPAQHHRLVTFAVEFLINVFHYGSRDGHVLVQHVIRETEIMTSLLMPYGLLCVECLPTASTAHMINESKRRQVAVVLSGLSRTLAGLVMMTFVLQALEPVDQIERRRLLLLRQSVCESNFTGQLLRHRELLSKNLRLLELLLKLNLNLNTLNPIRKTKGMTRDKSHEIAPSFLRTGLQSACKPLPAEMKAKMREKVLNGNTLQGIVFAQFTATYGHVWKMLDGDISELDGRLYVDASDSGSWDNPSGSSSRSSSIAGGSPLSSVPGTPKSSATARSGFVLDETPAGSSSCSPAMFSSLPTSPQTPLGSPQTPLVPPTSSSAIGPALKSMLGDAMHGGGERVVSGIAPVSPLQPLGQDSEGQGSLNPANPMQVRPGSSPPLRTGSVAPLRPGTSSGGGGGGADQSADKKQAQSSADRLAPFVPPQLTVDIVPPPPPPQLRPQSPALPDNFPLPSGPFSPEVQGFRVVDRSPLKLAPLLQTCKPPVVKPGGGVYTGAVDVQITPGIEVGAQVHFTLDWRDPRPSDRLFPSGSHYRVGPTPGKYLIKAVCSRPGYITSPVTVASFVIMSPQQLIDDNEAAMASGDGANDDEEMTGGGW